MKGRFIEIGTLVAAIVAGAVFIGQLDQRVRVLEVHTHGHAGVQGGTPGPKIEFQNDSSPGSRWSEPLYCPQGEYVCGLKQMLEPYQGAGKDDSGMNAVGFYCCPLVPDPPLAGTVK